MRTSGAIPISILQLTALLIKVPIALKVVSNNVVRLNSDGIDR